MIDIGSILVQYCTNMAVLLDYLILKRREWVRHIRMDANGLERHTVKELCKKCLGLFVFYGICNTDGYKVTGPDNNKQRNKLMTSKHRLYKITKTHAIVTAVCRKSL